MSRLLRGCAILSAMPSDNPLEVFAPGFNQAKAPWMVVGSIASSAYGEPRTTLDVDVVIVLGPTAANRFVSVFPPEEFYCPPPDVIAIEAARSERGHFNLVHHDTGFKADVYLATRDPFQIWALKNRRDVSLAGMPVWLAPPEYVIVHKLEFFREGRSEKHLRDIRGMLAVTDLERAIVEEEVARRGLGGEWRLV